MKEIDNEEKKKKEPKFPEGYEYFNELIVNGLRRRQEIDKELAAAGKSSSGPEKLSPKYTPPGFSTGRPSVNRDFYIDKLHAEYAKIETDIRSTIGRQIEVLNPDPETKAEIWGTLDNILYPNMYADKTPMEMEGLRKTEKDLQSSQDYMLRDLEQYREKSSRQDKDMPQPAVTNPLEEFSNNNTNSLDALKNPAQTPPESNKDQLMNEVTPTGDVKPVEQKPMSMSQRFSQSLHYTKAVEKAPEKSSPDKGKEDKSPDKE